MADLATTIHDAAKQPKRAMADGVSVEQHSLKDQIAAAQYIAGLSATGGSKTKLPIRLTKIKPGGAA